MFNQKYSALLSLLAAQLLLLGQLYAKELSGAGCDLDATFQVLDDLGYSVVTAADRDPVITTEFDRLVKTAAHELAYDHLDFKGRMESYDFINAKEINNGVGKPLPPVTEGLKSSRIAFTIVEYRTESLAEQALKDFREKFYSFSDNSARLGRFFFWIPQHNKKAILAAFEGCRNMELSGLWERKADDPYHHSSAFRNLPAEDSYLNRFRLSNEIDARNALLEAFLVTEIAYFPKVLFRRLRGAPNLDAITIRMKNISDQNFNLVHVIVAYYDIQNGTFELERKYFYNVSPNADMEVRKDRPKQDEAVVLAVYPINYTWSE